MKEIIEKTPLDWFFDKITEQLNDVFKKDGDLYETILTAYSIAKLKENERNN